MTFRQVTVVGLGLIGGSLGMALRRDGIARRVIGFSRSERTVRRAIARRAVYDGDTEFCPDWLGESDLVVLAVPPEQVVPMARKVARLTKHSFILTDVASVKGPIVRALERMLPSRIRFVGSHPMAGSERSGIEAADWDLFRGATCVLTRTARTNPTALRRVSRMWQRVGGRVVVLDPRQHDRLAAQISHVPHLTAVALTRAADGASFKLAAGGFSDTTRVALSDPEMWGQILRMNRNEVVPALGRLIELLQDLRKKVGHGASRRLSRELVNARRIRRNIEAIRQASGRLRAR